MSHIETENKITDDGNIKENNIECDIKRSSEENKTGDDTERECSEKNNSTDCDFTRANIEALGNRVRVTDQDETNNLVLFCYTHCSPEDEGIITNCRGVVFNDQQLVMRAFPYTVEFTNEDTDDIETHLKDKFDDCAFYDSHEGVLIRLFHFADKWYITTHRKLNAFRSKWASRESFGTAFKKALESEVNNNQKLRDSIPDGDEGLLERFQLTLDKDKQYMFIVCHSNENRIVCSSPERPTLYHVGTFVNNQLSLTENTNIPHPKKHNFKNTNEMNEYIKAISSGDNKFSIQGVICFAPNNKQYKIYNKDYKQLSNARGNEPSIKFRYLQIRMNRETVNMLYYLYPNMEKIFDETENTLYDIAKNIYNSYVQRFIKKRFVTVPVEEFVIIKACHKWHEQDRNLNRIYLNKVIEIMNTQPPTILNRLIRRSKIECREKVVNKLVEKTRQRSNTLPVEPRPSLLTKPPTE